ncbi:MAG: DUF721 domain-containing protein [Paludibacteraceae bacterium]|nr:DUF721 domain-containing protein [Paludibacteraceae bacterium]
MKKTGAVNIGEAVSRYFRRMGLQTKLDETALIQKWPETVGPMFAKYTTALSVQNRVLYVRISSSPAASELMMHKSKLVKSLNDAVGCQVIDSIQINRK